MEENNSTKKIIWSVLVVAILIILVVWGLAKTKAPAEISNDVPNENQAVTQDEQSTAAAVQAQSTSDTTTDIEADLNATNIDTSILDK